MIRPIAAVLLAALSAAALAQGAGQPAGKNPRHGRGRSTARS